MIKETKAKSYGPGKGLRDWSMARGGKRGLCLELLVLFFQEKRTSPRGNERDDYCFEQG